GARLAADEDACVRGGEPRDEPAQPLHLWRAAHESRVAGGGRELVAEDFVLPLQTLHSARHLRGFQGTVHTVEYGLQGEGLLEEAVGAEPHGMDGGVHRPERGHDHDAKARGRTAEARHEVEPAPVTQADVREYEVERLSLEPLRRLLHAGGALDGMAV